MPLTDRQVTRLVQTTRFTRSQIEAIRHVEYNVAQALCISANGEAHATPESRYASIVQFVPQLKENDDGPT